MCGEIYHYSPDDGYDPAIIVRCDYGVPASQRWIQEGEHSTYYCNDVDEIYVRDGEELWCKMPIDPWMGATYEWQKRFDATGFHKITDTWDDGFGCTLRVD